MRDIIVSNEKVLKNISSLKSQIKSLSNKNNHEIMAVIKYADEEDILSLINSNEIKILGENKVQDAVKRWEKEHFKKERNKIELHFIGHLQSNKLSKAVKIFDSIDTIDRNEIAEDLNVQAIKINKKMPVMIQLKINDSATQGGVSAENFETLFNYVKTLKGLSLRGILSIGPNTSDENKIYSSFRLAKEIYDKYFNSELNSDGFKNYLSLGMSGDYKIAIKAGSTLIRIGSLLFDK